MKIFQTIVDLAKQSPPGTVLALATVMKVRGAAYRRPGARMLITPSGASAGIISGGCLDGDVREHARAVMSTRTARLLTYDSTSRSEIIFGLGLGCSGVVQVLVEPVVVGEPEGLLAFFENCLARKAPGRIVTAFMPGDRSALRARMLRWPGGTVTATPLRHAPVLSQAAHSVGTRRTALREVEFAEGEGRALVLVETIAPPVPLYLFGAGDDAIPIAAAAKALGWRVTVIDARPAFPTLARFPMADAVRCVKPETMGEGSVIFPPESMIMILTHQFEQDRALLRVLLPCNVRYVGVLGPRDRTVRLLAELSQAGVKFDDAAIARLHGPAGHDLGAETPEEIAVSIIAEMIAVISGRSGGELRKSARPIHDPMDVAGGSSPGAPTPGAAAPAPTPVAAGPRPGVISAPMVPAPTPVAVPRPVAVPTATPVAVPRAVAVPKAVAVPRAVAVAVPDPAPTPPPVVIPPPAPTPPPVRVPTATPVAVPVPRVVQPRQ